MDIGQWDLVYAIDMSQVNAALANQKSKLLQQFEVDDYTQGIVPMKGTFGDWKIVPGGAGKIVHLSIGLENWAFAPAGGVLTPAPDVALKVEVDLLLLPTQMGQDLRLGMPAVRNLGFIDPPPGWLDHVDQGALADNLVQYLILHADEISFVLASISPSHVGAPAWLTPAELDFAYWEPKGGPTCLVIFAVTSPRDTSAYSRNVDPVLITPGKAGLGISSRLFLQNIFLPALASAYGAQPSQFVMSDDKTICNAVRLGLQSVSEAGETYYPELTALSAVLNDDHIHIALAGDCDMHMNASITYDGGSDVYLALQGTSELAFSSANATFNKDDHIPWYDHLLDIIGAVASIIFETVINVIAHKLKDDMGSVAGATAICAQAPNMVAWLGSSGLTPTDVKLASGLLLHGQIKA